MILLCSGASFPFLSKSESENTLAAERLGFLNGSVGKESCNVGDIGDEGLIPGSGRSPGIGNGNPLQYSCLGNPMERGAWQATVHRVAKSWTCQATEHTHKTEESRLMDRTL